METKRENRQHAQTYQRGGGGGWGQGSEGTHSAPGKTQFRVERGSCLLWGLGGQCSREQASEFAGGVAQEGARETRNPGPHLPALRKAALTIREDSATGGWAVGALEGLAVTIRDLPHPGVAVSRARQ